MAGLEALLTGRILADRYRIGDVIGRGGMAAVYQALDERLDRPVAVKVITLTTSDTEVRERARARFHREARAAARIDHPNVITVYDFGTDPETELDFLVMELLRGEDLAAHLAREGTPPLLSAVRILRAAALGLAAGHRLGLVHRDVKPSNLFLAQARDRHAVRVVVLDFGIAQVAAADQTVTQLTVAGRPPLSPAYASPEQLRGESELTPASDVFSLGVIGYQLLSGERLFDVARGGRRMEDAAVPVPSLRARNHLVPASIDAIILRALAHDPAERFADAGAFADALGAASGSLVGEAFSRPEPSMRRDRAPQPATAAAASASPGGPPQPGGRHRSGERHGRSRGTRSRLGPAAMLVALLGVAAVGGALWMTQQSDEPSTGRETTRQAVPAEAPAGGPSQVEVAASPAASEDAAVPPRAESLPISEAPVTGTEEAAPGPQVPNARQDPAVVPPRREEAQPAASSPGSVPAAQLNNEGVRLLQRGDAAGARDRFQRAIEREPRNVEYRNNYGWALYRTGELEAAERELRRVIELAPRRDIAYANLGEVRAARGDTASAIAMYERFLELNRDPRRRQIAEQKLRDLRGSR